MGQDFAQSRWEPCCRQRQIIGWSLRLGRKGGLFRVVAVAHLNTCSGLRTGTVSTKQEGQGGLRLWFSLLGRQEPFDVGGLDMIGQGFLHSLEKAMYQAAGPAPECRPQVGGLW